MSYFQVDDSFQDHPKFVGLGLDAVGLWSCGQAYCSRHLTDGFIPTAWVDMKSGGRQKGERVAATLVAANLWLVVAGGYTVKGYLDHNPSRADVEKKKADARARVGVFRERKRNATSETQMKRVTPALQQRTGNAAVTDPSTSTSTSTSDLKPPLAPPGGGRARGKRVASQVPQTAAADAEVSAWCAEWKLPNAAENPEVLRMIDHFRSTGGVKADWLATWRNWQRRAPEFAPRNGPRLAAANGTMVQEIPATGRLWKLPEGLPRG